MRYTPGLLAAFGAAALLSLSAPALASSHAPEHTTAASPRWQLVRSLTGAQMAASWLQGYFGDQMSCDTLGQVTVTGTDAVLSVDGTAGQCARLVSLFTQRFGRVSVRMFLSKHVLRDKHAGPAFWGLTLQQPSRAETAIMEANLTGHRHAGCASYRNNPPPAKLDAGPACLHLAVGWHTFTLTWSPHIMSYAYDGTHVVTFHGGFVHSQAKHWLVEDKSWAATGATAVKVAWFKQWKRIRPA
jgi:Glycosyl hydrolases family 16